MGTSRSLVFINEAKKKNIILVYLTVIPLARLGSESIAHEATRVNFTVYCTSVNFKYSYFYRV